MYQAIYREYRPEVFEDVIGQDIIVNILKNQIDTDSVSHAYLFCGTRGTGKTTTARLMAKAVNCLADNKPCGVCKNCKDIQNGSFIDLIEIDGASNNGVDDIRDVRKSVAFPPAVGKNKVYIIDEVHMLTKEALNAFLKTLEEPPNNIIFILATTEPQKLPQTILSRCLKLDFKRVSEKEIFNRMQEICRNKGVNIEDDALRLLATNADGSVRDGLTLLDQCIAGKRGDVLKREDVLDSLGAVGEDVYISLVDNIITKDTSKVILYIEEILELGKDPRQIVQGLIVHYRNLLLCKFVKSPENILNLSLENIDRLKKQSDLIELEQIDIAMIELAKTSRNMNISSQPRILLEVALIKLSAFSIEDKRERNINNYKSSFDIGEINEIPSNKAISDIKGVSVKDLDKTENVKDVENQYIKDYINSSDIQKNQDVQVDDQDKPLPDKNVIWQSVISMAIKSKPFLTLIKSSKPIILNKGEIVIECDNSAIEIMLMREKEFIQDVLKEITGRSLVIKSHIQGEKTIEIDYDETKKIAKEIMGIDLKIED